MKEPIVTKWDKRDFEYKDSEKKALEDSGLLSDSGIAYKLMILNRYGMTLERAVGLLLRYGCKDESKAVEFEGEMKFLGFGEIQDLSKE